MTNPRLKMHRAEVLVKIPYLPYPSERNREIATRAAQGRETFKVIAQDYGISMERVRQIFRKAALRAAYLIDKPHKDRPFPKNLNLGIRAANTIRHLGLDEPGLRQMIETKSGQRTLLKQTNFGISSLREICVALKKPCLV